MWRSRPLAVLPLPASQLRASCSACTTAEHSHTTRGSSDQDVHVCSFFGKWHLFILHEVLCSSPPSAKSWPSFSPSMSSSPLWHFPLFCRWDVRMPAVDHCRPHEPWLLDHERSQRQCSGSWAPFKGHLVVRCSLSGVVRAQDKEHRPGIQVWLYCWSVMTLGKWLNLSVPQFPNFLKQW